MVETPPSHVDLCFDFRLTDYADLLVGGGSKEQRLSWGGF